MLQEVTFAKGAVVLQQGKEIPHIYFLIQGEVRACVWGGVCASVLQQGKEIPHISGRGACVRGFVPVSVCVCVVSCVHKSVTLSMCVCMCLRLFLCVSKARQNGVTVSQVEVGVDFPCIMAYPPPFFPAGGGGGGRA